MAIGVFGRVSKLPCICTIHSVYTKNRIVLALYRIILKKNIPFILVSKDMRRYYEMLSHKTEFHIVENGINDLPEGELESALQTRRNRKKYIVGFVADVISKGWKYVVEAFENQRNLEQDIQLMIYGRDFDKSVNQYFNNPAYPNIIYCGFKKNAGTTVIPLLDAMILPSLSEGMPMSIIEALRAGVPVLATKVGGIPEMIIEDETGLFIERDAKDIADKINKIVTWDKSEPFQCRTQIRETIVQL
jgi:glycosyltransferase involved in cell wall biosynthesis